MKARTSFGQHTLGRDYFVSDEIWRAEHEKIFFRSWMLAGHVSQLETPGSYFLFELDSESVIVPASVPHGFRKLPVDRFIALGMRRF